MTYKNRRCGPTDAKDVRKAFEQYLPAKRNLAESLRARARILEAAADLRSPAANEVARGTAVSDPVFNAVIGSQQALRQVDINIAECRQQMDYAEWLLSLSEDSSHKFALRLRFFEGLSVMQAASEMNVSETTVKTCVRLACEAIALKVGG